MKAAALLQAYARGVRKRMQDKEEAERKLLGAPVETVFLAVSDYERRLEWDPLMEKGSKVISRLDAHTSLAPLKPV